MFAEQTPFNTSMALPRGNLLPGEVLALKHAWVMGFVKIIFILDLGGL